jgi:hypothetical protein
LIKQKSKQNNKTKKQQSNNMKKLIVTTLATTAVALGALAQGSISGIPNVGMQITTQAANAISPSAATTWYTGNLTLEVFWAASSTPSSDITAINALDGTANGGALALAMLGNDGFSEVSSSTLTGLTLGSVSGNANDGLLGGFTSVGLPGAPTGATGYLAFYLTGAGVYSTWSGVAAFAGQAGGNPNATPPGQQYNVATDVALQTLGGAQNLVLTSPVPEPATMALFGLGSLSLMLFRRKIS